MKTAIRTLFRGALVALSLSAGAGASAQTPPSVKFCAEKVKAISNPKAFLETGAACLMQAADLPVGENAAGERKKLTDEAAREAGLSADRTRSLEIAAEGASLLRATAGLKIDFFQGIYFIEKLRKNMDASRDKLDKSLGMPAPGQ